MSLRVLSGVVPPSPESSISGKRGFFSKILRRRASSLSLLLRPLLVTPQTSLTVLVPLKTTRSPRPKLQRMSLHSSHFDDESASFSSDDAYNERAGFLDLLSSQSLLANTLSDVSLVEKALPYESDRATEAFPPMLDDNDDLPLSKLTSEHLQVPKYVKLTKKTKHSPRSILQNLFLSQELNVDHCSTPAVESDAESIQGADSETEQEKSAPKNDHHAASATVDPVKSNPGEIFVMEFSRDGKYLAAAGRDAVIKIWKVISSPLGRMAYRNNEEEWNARTKRFRRRDPVFGAAPVFHQDPVRVFQGHTQSILSLDWSKNNFLISGSMDRTVRLWHVDRAECLQTFHHDDFVTSVKFHPNDDRFFLSGSLDNYVRLWLVLERSIAYAKNVGDEVLVTALCFTPDGDHCAVGGFNGLVFILETKGLHYRARFEVKDRSIVSAFQNRQGNKITGIQIFEKEAMSVETTQPAAETEWLTRWNVLITTNDSKVRLISSHLHKLVTRFRGLANTSSSIVASMSPDNHYIISGSEDHHCYVWENNNLIINNKLRVALKDFVIEGKLKLSDTQNKHHKYYKHFQESKLFKKLNMQKFLENADYQYVSNENNSYTSFHAHHSRVNAALFAPEGTKRLLELSDDIIYDLLKRDKKWNITRDIQSAEDTETYYGQIVVTTDQYGLIRVYRQDVAARVRKKIRGARKKQTNMPECLQVADSVSPSERSSSCKLPKSKKLDALTLTSFSTSPLPEGESFKNKLQKKFKANSIGGSSVHLHRGHSLSTASAIKPGSLSPSGPRITTSRQSEPSKMINSSSLINLKQLNEDAVLSGIFAHNDISVHVGPGIEDSSDESLSGVDGKLRPSLPQSRSSYFLQVKPYDSKQPERAADTSVSQLYSLKNGDVPSIINTSINSDAGSGQEEISEVMNYQTSVSKGHPKSFRSENGLSKQNPALLKKPDKPRGRSRDA